VIMPDTMSKERYERIKRYGGELELTPGSESDVILTLEKTRELMKNPKNRALAQFERRLIQERTNAGLKAARARGRLGGRPPMSLDDPRIQTAKTLHGNENVTV